MSRNGLKLIFLDPRLRACLKVPFPLYGNKTLLADSERYVYDSTVLTLSCWHHRKNVLEFFCTRNCFKFYHNIVLARKKCCSRRVWWDLFTLSVGLVYLHQRSWISLWLRSGARKLLFLLRELELLLWTLRKTSRSGVCNQIWNCRSRFIVREFLNRDKDCMVKNCPRSHYCCKLLMISPIAFLSVCDPLCFFY